MPRRFRGFLAAGAGSAYALFWGLALGCATQAGAPSGAIQAGTPAPPAATPPPKPPPPPAALVPDQPYVGTPGPVERPYLEILRLKEVGASDAQLLERIRAGSVLYSLSIYDIQKLRAAGVSEAVIEAMMASGRQSRTPTPPAP